MAAINLWGRLRESPIGTLSTMRVTNHSGPSLDPAPQDFVGHRIVMKMNQRSRGGVYEQGERISFGRPGRSPKGEWRGSRRAARWPGPLVGETQVCRGAAAAARGGS